MNQANWAALVLLDARLPTTPTNVDNLTRWMANEEPPSDWWRTNDPLNVGHPTTAPSGAFPSLALAAAVTAHWIDQPLYRSIRDALSRSAPVATFSAAVVLSPWSANHYGGTLFQIARTPVPVLVTAPGTKGHDAMATSIGTGHVAVDGVTAQGHKIVFVAPLGKESTAKAWSIMDLSDAAKLQGVAGATSFQS